MEEDKENENEIKEIFDKKLRCEEIKKYMENFKLVTENDFISKDDMNTYGTLVHIDISEERVNKFKKTIDYILKGLYRDDNINSDYEYILSPVLDHLFNYYDEVMIAELIKYLIDQYNLDLNKCHSEILLLNILKNSEIIYDINNSITGNDYAALRKKNKLDTFYSMGKILLDHIKIANHPKLISSIMNLKNANTISLREEVYSDYFNGEMEVDNPIYKLVLLINHKYLNETLPIITKIHEWDRKTRIKSI